MSKKSIENELRLLVENNPIEVACFNIAFDNLSEYSRACLVISAGLSPDDVETLEDLRAHGELVEYSVFAYWLALGRVAFEVGEFRRDFGLSDRASEYRRDFYRVGD